MVGSSEQLSVDLKKLIVECLALEDIAPEEIDTDAPLFVEGLGLDSIDALELAMAIDEKYGVSFGDAPEENQQVFFSVKTLVDYVIANSAG